MIEEGLLGAMIPGPAPATKRRTCAPEPRYFLTPPAPCPYLAGKTERKLFTELRGVGAADLNETLGRMGFRRSQNVAYRPVCESCDRCVSVRVPVADFTPSTSQRRLMRRHADLAVTPTPPWTTPEQYALLRSYLAARHAGGGMEAMDAIDYADMVEQTPVETRIVEYRAGNRLVAACITDATSDGLSLIYSFYETAAGERTGLGTFMILDHIARARATGLAYIYLGFWIQGAERMAYKTRFRPIERLTPEGWMRG